jgi:hypothetical protein
MEGYILPKLRSYNYPHDATSQKTHGLHSYRRGYLKSCIDYGCSENVLPDVLYKAHFCIVTYRPYCVHSIDVCFCVAVSE